MNGKYLKNLNYGYIRNRSSLRAIPEKDVQVIIKNMKAKE